MRAWPCGTQWIQNNEHSAFVKILSLNCQKGHQPGFGSFLRRLVLEETYDLVLLQEVAPDTILALQGNAGSYALIAPQNEITGTLAQTIILYRATFIRESSWFFPAGNFMGRIPRKEYGMVLGKFRTPGTTAPLWAASLHTHSGPRYWIREKEVRYFKEKIVDLWQEEGTVILGGDFNSGYPWEAGRHQDILSPDFVEVTKGIRHTCDSKYLERSNIRTAALSYAGMAGVNFHLAADHLFMDASSAAEAAVHWRLLEERVSDHVPLEASFNEASLLKQEYVYNDKSRNE